MLNRREVTGTCLSVCMFVYSKSSHFIFNITATPVWESIKFSLPHTAGHSETQHKCYSGKKTKRH